MALSWNAPESAGEVSQWSRVSHLIHKHTLAINANGISAAKYRHCGALVGIASIAQGAPRKTWPTGGGAGMMWTA